MYETRLKEEGEKSFQVRLNIFFTFVRDNSVEAEAYDMIQSVEGSVMNHDSVIIEMDDEETVYSQSRANSVQVQKPIERADSEWMSENKFLYL